MMFHNQSKYVVFVGMCCMTFQLLAANASAITRQKIIENAKVYAAYSWQVKAGNANSTYNYFKKDQWVTGVAYNWGGVDTIAEFEKKIKDGKVAGNVSSANGVQYSFAGIDCTGFVQQVWEAREDCFQVYISKGTYRKTCESNPMYCKCEVSTYLSQKLSGWDKLQAGDMLRSSGHARLFEDRTNDNTNRVWVYESTPGHVIHRIVPTENTYKPYKYNKVEETTTVVVPKDIGGLDLKKYCQQRGYPDVHVDPKNPYSWTCEKQSCGWTGYDQSKNGLSVNYACREQYKDSKAWAEAKDWGNAYSWTCYTKKKWWGIFPYKKELGGVNISGFCRKERHAGDRGINEQRLSVSTRYSGSYLGNKYDAGTWKCNGKSLYKCQDIRGKVDITQACREQKGNSKAYPKLLDPNSAYSWRCYVDRYVSVPATTTTVYSGTTGYMVTVAKTGTGSGTVTGAGINCGANCTGGKYDIGSFIDLQAIPDTNSTFAGWLLNGNPVNGAISISADPLMTAIFNQTTTMKRLYRLCLGACNGGTTWSNHMDSGSTNEFGFSCQRRLGQLLETQVSGTKPLYRIVRYRDASGRDIKDDHLATDTLSELVSGSTNEGIMGYVYTSQVSGTIPLYRKYRQYYYTIWGGENVLHTDHITTTDRNEGDTQGWQYERVLGYIMGPAASSCP